MAAQPGVAASHQREVRNSDHRWLLLVFVVFAAALLAFGVALWLYRATGPHPEMMLVTRRLKHFAKWLLPGV